MLLCLFGRRVYKERLGIPMNMTIGYQSHADTATKSGSTTKNKFVVWISSRAWISLSLSLSLSLNLSLLSLSPPLKTKATKTDWTELPWNLLASTLFLKALHKHTPGLQLAQPMRFAAQTKFENNSITAACYIHTHFKYYFCIMLHYTCSCFNPPNIHTSLQSFHPEKKRTCA